MPGIARVGVDSAGGTILGGGNTHVRVNGALAAVVGDAVAGHGSGAHANPTMVQGSSKVFIRGKAVCRAGDAASCGHVASGSGNTNAGG